jgi:HSP20 family protein
MALVRWQPFREIENLQRDMNHLFEALDNRQEVFPTFAPAAEMDADGENVYLRLEVPGLNPDEIEVQVNTNSIAIGGERKEEKNITEKGMKRSEFRYGKFHRTINLPEKIKHDGVVAKYKNGILHLTLPKAEDDRNKIVKVQVEA